MNQTIQSQTQVQGTAAPKRSREAHARGANIQRCLLPLLAILAGASAIGATNTFNGTVTSWNNSSGWSAGATPASTDALLINSSSLASGTTETIDNSFTVQNLSFDTGSNASTINTNATGTTAQTLTLTGGTDALGNVSSIDLSPTTTGVINLGTTSGVGVLTLALSSTDAINIGNSAARLNIGAVITGSSGLTLTGGGTLALSAANTFSGGTTITAGRLIEVNTGSALGSGTTSISSGATLEFNDNLAGTLSQHPTTFTGSGTIQKTGTGLLAFGNSGAVNVSLSPGGLIDVEAGQLNGSGGFQGNWTNNQGALNIASGATVGTYEEPITVDALTGSGTLSGGYNSQTSITTVGVANGSGTFSGSIVNSGALGGILALTKSGTGTETLTGANTYTGATTINAGTLQIGGAGSLGTSGTYSGTITDNGAFIFSSSANQTLGGAVSGTGGLTMSGAGVLTLTAANTYSGGTTISPGSTLQIGNGGGTGSLLTTGTVVDNGNLVYNQNSTSFINLPHGSAISGSGSLSVTMGGGSSGYSIFFNGNIALGGSMNFTEAGSNPGAGLYEGIGLFASTTLTGSSISMTGDVGEENANGNFSLALDTSAANGPINLNISLTRSGVWYAPSTFTANSGTGTITVAGTGPQSSGYNVTPVTLTGGVVNIPANVNSTAGVTINPSLTGTASGAFSGAMSLTMGGAGTLILTGSNTYSGSTTISGGTLQMGGAGTLGTSGTYFGAVVNNGAFVYNSSAVQTFAGATSGTGTTTVNSGTVKLLRGMTSSSPTTVNANGTLLFDNNGANWVPTIPAISLNSGTITYFSSGNFYTDTTTGAVTNQPGASSTINILATGTGNAGFFIDGGLKGSGTVTVNDPSSGVGLNLRNNNSTFSGMLIVNGIASTTVGVGSGIGVGGCTTGLQNADINLNGTMELLNAGMAANNTPSGNFAMGALSGTGVIVGNYTFSAGTVNLTLGSNGHNGTFSGLIANGANDTVSVFKSGTGTQIFNSANTYTGATTISGGTLQLGDGTTSNGSVAGNIVDNATLVFANPAVQTYSGVISGTGAVTMSGTGGLTLSNANTVSGPVTVNAGVLTLNAGNTTASALGHASLITVNSGAVVQSGTIDNGMLGYSETVPVTVNAGGTYAEANNTNQHIGGLLTLAGGTLASGTSPSGSAVTYGSLDLDGGLAAGGTSATSVISALGVVPSHVGGTVFTVNPGAANGIDLDVQGTLVTASGYPDTGIIKSGSGVMRLDSANTYSHGTTINAGRLIEFNNGTALGTGAVAVNSGATLELSNTTGTAIAQHTTTFAGAGTIQKTGTGQITFGNNGGNVNVSLSAGGLIDVEAGTLAGSASFNGIWTNNLGSLNIASGAIFNGVEGTIIVDALTGSGSLQGGYNGVRSTTIGVANGSGTFSGIIQDSGFGSPAGTLALIKAGTGTETLSGSNTYTGGTTISGGTIQLGDGVSHNGSVVGNITDNATLAFANPTAQIYAGVISGSGGVTVSGPGAETLSNASSFTGTTSVNAGGTLVVSGSLSASQVNVAGGTLAGAGLIASNVIIGTGSGAASSSVIQPSAGGGSVGTVLSTGSNLTLNSDAAYKFTLNSSNNSGITDALNVAGTLTINTGSTLTGLDFGGGTVPLGTQYLIAFAGGGFGGTFFSNAPQNSLIQIGSNYFTVDYTAFGGDGIELTAAVPEPATWAMMLGGLGMLVMLQRRRRGMGRA